MTFFEKSARFLEPLLHDKKHLFLSCLKFTLWAFYSILIVMVIKETTEAIVQNNREQFTHVVRLYILLVIAFFIINYIGRKWEWPILYYSTEKYIADTYVRKMMLLDPNYTESLGTGRLVSIMQNGIKRWNEQLSFLLRDFMRTLIVFIVTIYILTSMNQLYGGIFILCTFFLYLITGWIDSFARDFRKVRTDKRNEYSRKLVQIIMSKIEILQNNQIDIRANELKKIHTEIADADTGVAHSLFLLFNLPRVLLAIARIGILFFIGYGVFSGNFTIVDFTLAMTILLMFETFLLDSVETYKNFTKEFTTIQNLWDVIDAGPVSHRYDTGLPFIPHEGDIEMRNITYGYNETKVFEDFSVTIPYGKKTALVGASGGGKTTIMKLIAGYLNPESGSISVMGNTLSEIALKTYYPHIGYLTQDPSVFDGTIRENLISAIPPLLEKRNPEAKDLEQRLIEALRMAHCDFVFELEYGLDTEIGERGVRLSGGQKQRLAIAKIFLKDPEIILLDEPTSALDSFSEERITEALNTLFRGRTVVIVAHRLQTVKKADDIIVIEGGAVIERGAHAELVKKGGIYQKMLELQSGF